MAKLSPRPDADNIQYTYEHLKDVWSDAHADWRIVDSFYQRNYPVWPAELKHRKAYRPSTPTSVVDHAVDTMMSYSPRVHRTPVTDGQSAQDAADRVEIGVKWVFDNCAKKELSLSYKLMGRHLLTYGYTVGEGPVAGLGTYDLMNEKPDRDKGEDEDDYKIREATWKEQRKTWNPLAIRAPHPSRVFLDPMQKQPPVACVLRRLYAQNVHDLSVRKKGSRRYAADVFELGKLRAYDYVDILDFYTRDWHSVMVEGGAMLWTERTAGFQPFSHAYAGFGMEPTDLDEVNPRHMAVGLLHPIMDSIRVQAQNRSAAHEAVMLEVYRPHGTRLEPSEVAQQIERGGLIPGEKNDVWVMEPMRLDPSLFEIGREADQDIQQGSYQRSLSGSREPGVYTVGATAIMANAANRKFGEPSVQIQHLASIAGGNILRMVVALDERIGSLVPADIGYNFDIDVYFDATDPVLKLQQQEIGLREYQAGLKSAESYRELAGVENESQERRRLIREEIRKTPEIARVLAMEIAADEGIGAEFDEAMQMRGAAAQDGRTREAQAPEGQFNDLEGPTGPAQATRELRQPLTDQVAKPSRRIPRNV